MYAKPLLIAVAIGMEGDLFLSTKYVFPKLSQCGISVSVAYFAFPDKDDTPA